MAALAQSIVDLPLMGGLIEEDISRAVPRLVAERSDAPLMGHRIDPGAFLARMAEGYRPAPTLERTVAVAVHFAGDEFGEFMARRYGGRVARAVVAIQAEA